MENSVISLESSNFPKFNLAKGVSCVITAIIVIKKEEDIMTEKKCENAGLQMQQSGEKEQRKELEEKNIGSFK